MRELDASTDGPAFRSLCAANLGPYGCLRAGGDESELIGKEYGVAAPHICRDCGLLGTFGFLPSDMAHRMPSHVHHLRRLL